MGLYFTHRNGPIFRAKTDLSDLQCIDKGSVFFVHQLRKLAVHVIRTRDVRVLDCVSNSPKLSPGINLACQQLV